MMMQSLKIEQRNVLHTVERNQLMAKATGYLALYSVFFKVSIEENPDMVRQSERLER